jgi:hypothetical protein
MAQHISSAALAAFLLAGSVGSAAEEPRPEIGKLMSAEGTLFQRGKLGEAWRIVPAKGAVHAGDLLLGMPGAVVETAKGAVRLTFLGDLDKNSPYPILEAAVILHASPECEVDFTLDRGRVDVANLKDKGAARVDLRFHDQKWRATLEQPGARIAVELYGRWPKGARFTPEADARDVPAADLLLLVRKGRVELRHGTHHHSLSAPPGPALIHWDNSGDRPEAPQKLDTLPEWASEKFTSERAQQIEKALEAFRRAAVKSSPRQALRDFVASDDADKRSVAIITMGAMDDLEGLGEVLTATRYRDAWDRAVVVLRHWLGRGPGQDQFLYRYLIEKRDIKPAQAATILQLLHSFDDVAPRAGRPKVRLRSARPQASARQGPRAMEETNRGHARQGRTAPTSRRPKPVGQHFRLTYVSIHDSEKTS